MPFEVLEEWRNARRVASLGWRLALFRQAPLGGVRYPPALFWIGILLSALIACGLSWWSAEEPRRFESAAIASSALDHLLTLFAAFLLARGLSRDREFWPLAILTTWAMIPVDIVATLAFDRLVPLAPRAYTATVYWSVAAAAISWWAVLLNRTAALLIPVSTAPRRLGLVCVAVTLLVISAWYVPSSRYWTKDWLAESHARREQEAPHRTDEEAFSAQPVLLHEALAKIAPSTGHDPQLYFLAFAPYGAQGVFYREAAYGARLFETRFGARDRALVLANTHEGEDRIPMASLTNLEEALRGLASRMDVSKDILFLFITSHGSRDARVSSRLDGLDFRPVSADALADALHASGIRWAVVLVSACYSGSFVPALEGPETLVMTAASADQTSFGCSDTGEFTDFGRAYFLRALNQTASFTEAFAQARKLIAQWETQGGRESSDPQIASAPAIEAQLARWQATLPDHLPTVSTLPHEDVLRELEGLEPAPPADP